MSSRTSGFFSRLRSATIVHMQKIVSGEVKNGTLCLAIKASRLDAASARDFKKECEQLWRPEIERLTIDMHTVEFLDSSGVGALLSVYKRLPRENPSVKLLRVTPPVQSVIELLQLHRIFEIQA